MTDRPIENETTLTEITIHPDGRVYVFGPSLGILELLEELAPNDLRIQTLLSHIRRAKLPEPHASEAL